MKHNDAAKRFLPFVFLAVLWLLILIVPHLNWLFRVQLQGSTLTQFSVLPAPDDVPNFWEKSARRFPDNAYVLWQAANEYPVSEAVESEAEVGPIAASPAQNMATPRPDPTLPPSQIFPGQLEGDLNAEKQRRMDLLIARFPNNADLIAARLRTTFGTMGGGRVGGELSDGNLDKNQAAGKPSPEKSEGKPNYLPEDLQRAISLAQRGQKLEPDNGFFDWMECCFSMYAWRDAQAFAALDRLAKKPRFDDHSLQEQQAKNAALETAFGRRLLLEEKAQNLFAETFPHFARYREMARILSWQSIKAGRRGDHRTALRITAGLARAGAKMRENSRTFIEGLVAIAIESIAWSNATYDARAASRSSSPRVSANQRVASFQTYAAKHGRPELAAEAARNYTAGAKYGARVSTGISNGNAFGTPFWVFILIALLWILGVLLLLLLPIALLLPALFWAWSRTSRVKGVLPLADAQAEIPSAREVWNGALACGGLRAIATAICGALVFGSTYSA